MAEGASPPSREPPEGRGRFRAALINLAYAAMLAFAIWLFVSFPMSTARSVSYSDFLQMVRIDQISEVFIDAHRIGGTIKGETQTCEGMLLWGVILRRNSPGQGVIAFERSRRDLRGGRRQGDVCRRVKELRT